MSGFTYLNERVPTDYSCSSCKSTGCKLWRQYNTFVVHLGLLCVDCALADQKKDPETLVDERGKHESVVGELEMGPTDQIGWLVPAVPTEDGESYWGYTSVPEAGCLWWRALPTRTR